MAAAALCGQEWTVYGGDAGGQRYSEVAEITAKNVSKLKLAWQYGIDPRGIDSSASNRVVTSTDAVPIMVGSVLYAPTVPAGGEPPERHLGIQEQSHLRPSRLLAI